MSRAWRRRLARAREALKPDSTTTAQRPLGLAKTVALFVASLVGATLVTAWLPATRAAPPGRAEALARVTRDGLAALVQGREPGEDGFLHGVGLAEAWLLSLFRHLGAHTAAPMTTVALAGLFAAVATWAAHARGIGLAALSSALVLAMPATRGAIVEGNAGALIAAASLVVLLRAQTVASEAAVALAAAGWALATERMAPGLAALVVLVLARRSPLRRALATATGLVLGGAAPWGWTLANAAFSPPEAPGWTTSTAAPAGVASVALLTVGVMLPWMRTPTARESLHTATVAAMLVAAGPTLAATLLHVAVVPGSTELAAGLITLVSIGLAAPQGDGAGSVGKASTGATSTAGGMDGGTTGGDGAATTPPT